MAAEIYDNWDPVFDRYNHIRLWRRVYEKADQIIEETQRIGARAAVELVKAQELRYIEKYGAWIKGKCYACDYVERFIIDGSCNSCPLDWPMVGNKKRCTNTGSPFAALIAAAEAGDADGIRAACATIVEYPLKTGIKERVEQEYYAGEVANPEELIGPRIKEITETLAWIPEDVEKQYRDARPIVVRIDDLLQRYTEEYLVDDNYAARIEACEKYTQVNDILEELENIREDTMAEVLEMSEYIDSIVADLRFRLETNLAPIVSALRRTDLTDAEEDLLVSTKKMIEDAQAVADKLADNNETKKNMRETCIEKIEAYEEQGTGKRASLIEAIIVSQKEEMTEKKDRLTELRTQLLAIGTAERGTKSDLEALLSFYDDVEEYRRAHLGQYDDYKEIKEEVEDISLYLEDLEVRIGKTKALIDEYELSRATLDACTALRGEITALGLPQVLEDTLGDIEAVTGLLREFDDAYRWDPVTGEKLKEYDFVSIVSETEGVLNEITDFRNRCYDMSVEMVTEIQETINRYVEETYDAITEESIEIVVGKLSDLRSIKVLEANILMEYLEREDVLVRSRYEEMQAKVVAAQNSYAVTPAGLVVLGPGVSNMGQARVLLEAAESYISAADSVYDTRLNDTMELIRRAGTKQKNIEIGANKIRTAESIMERNAMYARGCIDNLVAQLLFYGSVDDAIRTASYGRFTSAADLIEQFETCMAQFDLSNPETVKSLLVEECDIDVDNEDTGAVSGWDIGGSVIKTEIDVMKDDWPIETWIDPVAEKTVYSNLVTKWPQDLTSVQGLKGEKKINNDKVFIRKGLYSVWLKTALRLILDAYSYLEPVHGDFLVPGNANRVIVPGEVEFAFEDEGNERVRLEYEVKDPDGIEYAEAWMPCKFKITTNMKYFGGVTGESGIVEGERPLDVWYAKMLCKVLLINNVYKGNELPEWLLEGLCEVLVGGDRNKEQMIKGRFNELEAGMRGYVLIRYFGKQSARIHARVLTNSWYRMSQLFLHDYDTMNEFPLMIMDFSGLTTGEDMFWGCADLEVVDMRFLSGRNMTSMARMFYSCKKLTQVGTKEWPLDCASCTNLEDMCSDSGIRTVWLKNVRSTYKSIGSGIYEVIFGKRSSYSGFSIFFDGQLVGRPR